MASPLWHACGMRAHLVGNGDGHLLETVHVCYPVHLHSKTSSDTAAGQASMSRTPVQLTRGIRRWMPGVNILTYFPKRSMTKAVLSGTMLRARARPLMWAGHVPKERSSSISRYTDRILL